MIECPIFGWDRSARLDKTDARTSIFAYIYDFHTNRTTVAIAIAYSIFLCSQLKLCKHSSQQSTHCVCSQTQTTFGVMQTKPKCNSSDGRKNWQCIDLLRRTQHAFHTQIHSRAISTELILFIDYICDWLNSVPLLCDKNWTLYWNTNKANTFIGFEVLVNFSILNFLKRFRKNLLSSNKKYLFQLKKPTFFFVPQKTWKNSLKFVS